MNAAQVRGLREMAQAISREAEDWAWQVVDAKGYVVAFNLTHARATDWARFYKGATVRAA